MRTVTAAVIGLTVAACAEVDAAGADDDPLGVDDAPATGSFDDLHRRIITPRCSGTPGLCHYGQFEPNLSTPSLAYAYLVNRPSIEKPTRWRIQPGRPGDSVLIDKLRGRSVATRMPLGAEPLDEVDIAAIEAWIAAGALRRPGAEAAPLLNEPPRPPEIGIYRGATRLDLGGATAIQVGDVITFRHSVHDFETADAQIPFAAFVLMTGRGNIVVVPSAAEDPHVAPTEYDPSGPMGAGDLLNWRFTWTVPATLELYDEGRGTRTPVPAAGQTFYPIAVYLDSAEGGIPALRIDDRVIQIQ